MSVNDGRASIRIIALAVFFRSDEIIHPVSGFAINFKVDLAVPSGACVYCLEIYSEFASGSPCTAAEKLFSPQMFYSISLAFCRYFAIFFNYYESKNRCGHRWNIYGSNPDR